MTATQIQRMLADRHKDDVYVSECKDGATWDREHVRLDGWAMEKSWRHPRMIGYEIKVSRSDFLQDKKWPEYLPLCNELYFVCPAKLIQPEELPEHVGLIWAGGRLVTKRKAAHRQVTDPSKLFKYVLMCRSRIGPEVSSGDSRDEKLAVWRRWLAEKRESRELGYQVKREIREMIRAVKNENDSLKRENERLALVKAELKKLELSEHTRSWELQSQLELRRRAFSTQTLDAVNSAIRNLQVLQNEMNKHAK